MGDTIYATEPASLPPPIAFDEPTTAPPPSAEPGMVPSHQARRHHPPELGGMAMDPSGFGDQAFAPSGGVAKITLCGKVVSPKQLAAGLVYVPHSPRTASPDVCQRRVLCSRCLLHAAGLLWS
jgi:hypothetical protein